MPVSGPVSGPQFLPVPPSSTPPAAKSAAPQTARLTQPAKETFVSTISLHGSVLFIFHNMAETQTFLFDWMLWYWA